MFSEWSMPENTRLSGSIDQINLAFVEREATPRLLMKLGIQLHLAGLSLSNTVSILAVFGVERARSTVHNWVHKADLQPESGRSPDHVAVDETVIRLNDERYWLYAAVDPETNELLHTKLEPTTNKVIAHSFFTELREKHNVDDAVFLIDGSLSLKDACSRHGLDFRYERHGNRNSVERVFREVKRRTSSFSNCFSNAEAETADDWLRSFAFAWNQLI
ncbi:Transposase (plasmid) [Halapricum desulfuricans]|uniref:Transposase n=2 Tax=Halapricum desulfuricans TaxID=2841257 RepID=A0A897NU25_9EURY|nr:Transposase [Halapricum desulfuricans]